MTEAVFVLWWRPGPGRWKEVFRGSKAEFAAEESRLIVGLGWAGDFYRAPLGQKP